jgi:hypothetical protein
MLRRVWNTGVVAVPRKRSLLGIGVLVLALTVAGCGGGGEEAHTLNGTLTAPGCGGGYEIEETAIEIRNESNTIIGNGSTGADQDSSSRCQVGFTVTDLPKADFYQIKIGTHGGPSYTLDELEANDWNLSLSLGD